VKLDPAFISHFLFPHHASRSHHRTYIYLPSPCIYSFKNVFPFPTLSEGSETLFYVSIFSHLVAICTVIVQLPNAHMCSFLIASIFSSFIPCSSYRPDRLPFSGVPRGRLGFRFQSRRSVCFCSLGRPRL
jgi:hypothetical protein